jgi:hypothetical protein
MTRHPACGICQSLASPNLYEDDLWCVRHAEPAGPALRRFERVLEQVTGALRIYTAAMGESHPHFHAHMVPRTATMPRDAKAWSVFDLQRAVGAGEIPIDRAEIARISEAYRLALAGAR